MTKGKKYRKMSKNEVIVLLLVVVFAIALIFCMVKPMLKTWAPFKEKQGELNADTNSYEIKSDVVEEIVNQGDGLDLKQIIEGQYTVLGLGFDEDGTRTDVMMLFLFDIKGGKINILQLQRDTFVGDFTKNETGKLNSVFSSGKGDETGINKLVNTIRDMLEIPIDSYIGINCNDVPPVVDALGGIPINVPQQIDFEPGKVIKAGQQVLTGEQSEWFVRFRKGYVQADIGRMKAQRMFLAAAMVKMKDVGTATIVSKFSTLQKYIMSDMDLGDIGKLSDFCQTVSMDNVTSYMAPGESVKKGEYNKYDIWTLHKQETADLLNNVFRPYQAHVPAESLPIVEIKNTSTYFNDDNDNFGDIINGENPDIPMKK